MFRSVKVEELPDGPQCCGQGGLFQVAHPELALQIREQLLDDFSSLAVQTGCSGCLLQWQLGLAAGNKGIQVEHLAIFIAKLLQ
jgi:glycolate oxidase iron-sulfur subunit